MILNEPAVTFPSDVTFPFAVIPNTLFFVDPKSENKSKIPSVATEDLRYCVEYPTLEKLNISAPPTFNDEPI